MKDKLILPYPSPKLMPNRTKGQHWAVTHKARDKAKFDAMVATRDAGWKHLDVSHGLKITIYTPDNRKRDTDNLLAALKPSLDGVAQGIMCDDKQFNPLFIERVDGVGRLRARVEIERLQREQLSN